MPSPDPNLDTVEEGDKLAGLHITSGSPPPDGLGSSGRRESEGFHWERQGKIDGETTPRRIPSPPPNRNTVPEDDEDEEAEDEEDDEAVRVSTPPASPMRRLEVVAPTASRRRQAAVLGFDHGRYGR